MLTGKELSFFKFGIPLFDCSLVSKRHPLLNNSHFQLNVNKSVPAMRTNSSYDLIVSK